LHWKTPGLRQFVKVIPSRSYWPHLEKSTLIYNPVAGRRPAEREREVRAAAAVLRKAGLKIELAPTERPNMAHELAQAAVASGVDVILACGGDGPSTK